MCFTKKSVSVKMIQGLFNLENGTMNGFLDEVCGIFTQTMGTTERKGNRLYVKRKTCWGLRWVRRIVAPLPCEGLQPELIIIPQDDLILLLFKSTGMDCVFPILSNIHQDISSLSFYNFIKYKWICLFSSFVYFCAGRLPDVMSYKPFE